MSIGEFSGIILKLLIIYILGQILAFLEVRRASTKVEGTNAKGLLDGHLLPKNKATGIDMYTLPLLRIQEIFCG